MAIKKSNSSKGVDNKSDEDRKGEAEQEVNVQLKSAISNESELVQETTKTRNRGGGQRGVCAMGKVLAKKGEGEVVKVTYNEYGIPNGSTRSTLQSYIGFRARTMVSILYPSWPEVPKTLKDNLWKDFQATFTVAPESKGLLLKSAGVKWRQFKAILTTRYVLPYIGHTKKLSRPPTKYKFICLEVWKKFVADRTSPKWLALNKKQSDRVAKRKYPHRLSRKGYIGLEEEEANAGHIEPGEIPDRAKMWKKARMTKDKMMDPELVEIHDKIDALLEKKSNGEFKPSGNEDVLSAVLENPEHSGRVRGVAGYVNPTMYFNMPKGKRVRITKAELMARDRKRTEEMEKDKEEMQKNNEELRQEITELKTMIKSIQASQGILPSPKCSEKASFYPQHDDHQLLRMNSATQMDCNLDNEVKVVDSPILTTEKKDPIPCDLAVDSKDNKVAFGTFFPETEANYLINGVPMKPGHVRVSVDSLLQPDALLPKTVRGTIEKVCEALGCHLAWPEDMVIFKTPTIVETKKKPKKEGEMARMQKLYQKIELTKNVPQRFRLLYKNATTFMETSGVAIQIPCDVEVFGLDKTIFVLNESIIALCHFDQVGQAVIAAYMAYLHTIVRTEKEMETFAFVDPGATHYLNAELQNYLVRRLEEGSPDRMFFVPHNENKHWILSIIWEGEVYILNPLPGAHSFTAWEKALIGAINTFNAKTGRGKKVSKVKYLPGCPKQPGGSECGYAVMQYMRHIITEKELDFATKWNTKTRKAYTRELLDEVRYQSLEYIEQFM